MASTAAFFLGVLASCTTASAPTLNDDPAVACPGYGASNVQTTSTSLSANLTLAGTPCHVYGQDIQDLTLQVTYEAATRLHVKIQDAANSVYQVPESVLPRPSREAEGDVDIDSASLVFNYTTLPFSFTVARRDTGEILFDTSAASLVFENQYLRLRTHLPEDPNIYGLGEHSDALRLNTTDYIRTLWSRDAYGTPNGENLYGNHPVYFDHRGANGTHGVFLLNSNGMDIVINKTADDGTGNQGQQYLEYNTLGGVLDFYFIAGPSPVDVASQYADVVGRPAMQPYWGLGFHQCRYGYQDVYNVAEVVQNYSNAQIPLETMWTDIDYMDLRKVFSLDPQRFPLDLMQQLVHHLHSHEQHYIMMVDPAVAYNTYAPFERGLQDNVFLLRANGSVWQGVVWPGVTVFPDWFSANITAYWDNEFDIFFNAQSGVNIDALWIDMNEPSNFACDFPCDNAAQQAAADGYPPEPPALRTWPRPLPGWPCDFQPPGFDCNATDNRTSVSSTRSFSGRTFRDVDIEFSGHSRDLATSPHFLHRRQQQPQTEPGQQLGLPGRNLLYPEYAIHNYAAYLPSWNAAEGGLSNLTVNTDVLHQNGLAMYDTHNLYGTMMSSASRTAMLSRRPSERPLIITRSTFSGAGAHVGHWLGDNFSDWPHYRRSIAMMLAFASIYQVPLVGSDVCGYAEDTTEQLCARWAMLGAFSPFYRNHNTYPPVVSQEFYLWPETVAVAARKAIAIRYRLLDYIYTALYRQSVVDGTPLVSPVFYLFPEDEQTFGLDLEYFYGNALLVAPVTEENATSVDVYLPGGAVFYDWYTLHKVQSQGWITVADQEWTDLPLFLKGGHVVPLRSESAMTTKELREKDFTLLIVPDADGMATGELYVDDGVSLEQNGTTWAQFTYYANGTLVVNGTFEYAGGEVVISNITLLGYASSSSSSGKNGTATAGLLSERKMDGLVSLDEQSGALKFTVSKSLRQGFTMDLLENL
ncbi:glycosyl hydrolases family 31-domain-containing protein [Coniella lustricola]|uniref:Glycosyl hydrolases family 31-domain-containing protein n=1 Tax=Coniella lustricola TaxID=2025994 RepID=A0A2T3AH73_9PEZI|nr:glycosyl hydrolases family 31-domain-containing protein [Coniella lustricola]